MKIAMPILDLPTESKMSGGYVVHAMANALTRRGHEVCVFSPCAKPEDGLYDYRRVEAPKPLRTFRFAWNLRKIDFSSFDVIHAQGDDYWLWGRALPAHIRTMHGSCFAEAVHVAGLKNKFRMLLLGLSEFLATAVADKTVCVSENTRRYYPWLKTVIPNGVNLAAFGGEVDASMTNDQRPMTRKHETPEGSAALQINLIVDHCSLIIEGPPNSSKKESCPTILFVGTYQNRKRGKLLQDLFTSRILPALPSAQLWMVCSDAPAAAGVTVFGRIPEEQLTDLYRRAWVFCLPSTYEGFGIPYIEAMAAGTAVVASPNVGALEVTRHGQDGLVPKDDKLAETLLMVLANPQERQRLEAAGTKRVKDFDLNTVCERYEQIYEGLIARKHKAPGM